MRFTFLSARGHHGNARDGNIPLFSSTEKSRDYIRPSAREPSPDRTLTNEGKYILNIFKYNKTIATDYLMSIKSIVV